MPPTLCEISIGMVLGDTSLFKYSKRSGIKFEQGSQQREFLFHLFSLFSNYTFVDVPGQRLHFSSLHIKSFWFKTFSHYSFTGLWNLFYKLGKKILAENLIKEFLTPIAFAFWVMCDGSLQRCKKVWIIHTSCFTQSENAKEFFEK